ncbi:MAG: N-acetylmuramoyl-L-alanine amidase [Saprospiraceae bacterium]|nr:N-acetylmuramoyl-L-alanine amidase [Saprospiraceae bacterium]MDW8229127.1 N-acetylmuramoyl-L-alanine amidase [Saprospiraceae bacterium]
MLDVRRTLLGWAAWLFLGNFNGAIACHSEGLHAGCHTSGKGRQTLQAQQSRSVFQLLQPYFTDETPTGYRLRKVVLDAGHGGKDSGCRGATSLEKHNALAIVLKLGALIEAEYPDVQVIYTRKTDVFVELQERAAIANRNNADLFISIHCNSVSVSHIKGVETYVMGLHTAESNLEVAKRENSVIVLEENYQRNYGGYNPNSPEAHIFSSLWQSAYLEQSILFADYVQKYTRSMAKREDRNVRQAGFIVLHRTAMPAVLIEVGYLTNRDEERFLASEEGQIQMADAIFEAFRAYKARMEGMPLASRKNTAAPAQILASATTPTSTATTPAPTPTASTTPAPVVINTNTAVTPAPSAVPYETTTARVGDRYADEFIDLPPSAKDPKGQYRILLLSWNAKLDRNVGQLALLTDVEEEYANGQYHYYLGRFTQRTEAEKLLPDLYNLGFRTARIVSK